MDDGDPQALVMPDTDAEKAKEELKKQREEVARLKKKGRRQLERGLDLLDDITASAAGETGSSKRARKTVAKRKAAGGKASGKGTSGTSGAAGAAGSGKSAAKGAAGKSATAKKKATGKVAAKKVVAKTKKAKRSVE